MKAIVVRKPGGLDVLRLEDVPDPTPGPRDVLIQVARCGVCFHEVVTRKGTLRRGVVMPLILGHEIAGTVAALGADVRGFRPGEQVTTVQRSHICGQCRFCRTGMETVCPEHKFLGDYGMNGGYAEYVLVEEDNVAAVPEGVSLEEAAITACAIGTELNAIREVGRVQPGDSVLITGAGGGLGVHAIQLARLAGAFVVAATSSPDKVALVREMGAHEVVLFARGEDFSDRVKDATNGNGVTVVIDNVGSPVFNAARRSLDQGGRLVLVGELTGDFVPFNPAQLFLKGISLLSAKSTTRKQLQDSLQLVQRGQIKPIITETLPLAAAAQVHRRMEEGSLSGRLLLDPTR